MSLTVGMHASLTGSKSDLEEYYWVAILNYRQTFDLMTKKNKNPDRDLIQTVSRQLRKEKFH